MFKIIYIICHIIAYLFFTFHIFKFGIKKNIEDGIWAILFSMLVTSFIIGELII